MRRVLAGRHKQRRGRPPKGLKAAQAAAAASGRSLEDLVAEASELHGISADESADESPEGGEEEARGRQGRGATVGPPPRLARHFQLRRAKRKWREGEQQQELQLEEVSGREGGKGSRGRTQQQQQRGSSAHQLLPPPPARRLVWIELPHRLPDSERRGLRKVERKQGRAAQANQELREALERELGARERGAAPAGSLNLAGGPGKEGPSLTAAAAGRTGSGDGGFGRGGGAPPQVPLADSMRPQPHPHFVRQIARERLR